MRTPTAICLLDVHAFLQDELKAVLRISVITILVHSINTRSQFLIPVLYKMRVAHELIKNIFYFTCSVTST